MSLKKARVLSGFELGGKVLNPNDVIEATPAKIKSLGDAVDATPAAVKFCLENGAKVTRIGEDSNPASTDADDEQDGNPDASTGE